jgi:molybdopterin-guanine dinucleotide biosynthesis protein A
VGEAGLVTPYDAVVLAGGSGRRLGGADKPALRVGGRTLLDGVLDAVADAERVVVVGPPRASLPASVRQVREEPPGGGPAAAVAAGLREVHAPSVAVLAADLPLLTPAVVAALRRAADPADGALLVDADGRDQVLTGVWSTAALRRGVEGRELAGAPLRVLLRGLRAVRVPLTDAGAADWFDCDTDDDLRRAREHA